MRRFLCLLLALCLTMGMLPMQVLADETTAVSEDLPSETTAAEEPETTEETEPSEEPEVTEETEASEDRYHARSSSMSFGTEDARLFWDVPNYYQNDYPDTPYGGGTVATSGCTITCLAMAASYLLGRDYAPDRLAEAYQSAGSDNIQRMEAAADSLGLAYEKAYDWGSVMRALRRNKIVIVMLEDPSPFTSTGHTVVLTGLTGGEHILVNDPKRENYGNPDLIPGFEGGFREEELSQGFTGCWIFEDTDAARNARASKAAQKAPRKHEHVELDSVPLYRQTDYLGIRYGDGTLATSGCTLTCLAMVASYLRQEEILPDELAKRFGTYESSNIQRMEAASIVLDLPFETTLTWWETREALKQGKIAIVLVEAESEFTYSQHTVVATGITPDGKIRVHDPNGDNYEKEELKDGFANGFPEDMLSRGFSGAWIYDRYEPVEPRQSRYPDFELTDADRYMIASIIWLEARGEPFEGQRAVAEVIFNRLASGKFSKTVQGTIMAQGQFRTAKFLDEARPGELQYKAIDLALNGHNILPENVYFFSRSPANKNKWGKIGNHVFCYGA